jgi:hypothetical protein
LRTIRARKQPSAQGVDFRQETQRKDCPLASNAFRDRNSANIAGSWARRDLAVQLP